MLLINLKAGGAGVISKIYNKQLTTRGFIKDARINVISKNNDNFIVEVNGIRTNITKEVAKQISVY